MQNNILFLIIIIQSLFDILTLLLVTLNEVGLTGSGGGLLSPPRRLSLVVPRRSCLGIELLLVGIFWFKLHIILEVPVCGGIIKHKHLFMPKDN